MTMFVLQLKTHTIFSPLTPFPFDVNVNFPETVNGEPGVGVDVEGDAVSIVELGLVSEPVLRVSVIVPDPLNLTVVGSFEPEHVNPPVQVQLDTV